MFPIDPTLLPSLATRKALLVVDAQNDFLAEDGALPVTIPIELPQKISDLAGDFRRNGGDIIWVQSEFERSRPIEDEQIMISNTPNPSSGAVPTRGRRSRTTPPVTEPPVSPEAFLTPDATQGPTCVTAGAVGTEMHPVVKQAVGPKDSVLTKTFYSAFKVEELLRVLRVRFVTELFICGSSTNVGVMATAIDAASYGYTITIVSDCCGAQSISRHRAALGQITSTTGCDTLPAAAVLSMMKPKPKPGPASSERVDNHQPHRHRDAAGGRSPTVRLRRGKRDATAPSASDIQPSFERLSLSGESAAAHEHASTIIAPPEQRLQQQRQSESRPQSQPQSQQSQSQSQSTLQPMARTDHSQTKNQTDRDIIAATPNRRPPAPINRNNHNSNAYLPASADVRNDENSDDGRYESVRPNEQNEKDEKVTMASQQSQPKAQSSPLCEGDTKVIYDILPEAISDHIFARIRSEVAWQRMSHQGGEVPRLVAVQGLVEADGSKPVYRHPADESPPLYAFTPAVDTVRAVVEKELGHPLNHVLIQLYRGSTDYISEHSDKTLDIARDSFIANVSLGAERTMTLRTKRKPKDSKSGSGQGEEPKAESGSGGGGTANDLKRQIQRARLPHNSLFQMGLATNARWLHGIRQDKRPSRNKQPAELAYNGARISLTFRHISTFLTCDEARIWGQGATAKTRKDARAVINGLSDSAVAMLRAFGRENQATEFDWDENYGVGFDVLHITTAKRLFLSGDAVVNLRLRSLMAELGIAYARGSLSGGDDRGAGMAATEVPVKFVDNDEAKTAIVGQREIMLYAEETYGGKATLNEEDVVSKRFEQGMGLLDTWRREDTVKISDLLALWEEYAAEATFIAGPEPSLADFAFWPVLYEIFSSSSLDNGSRKENKNQTLNDDDNNEKQGEEGKRGPHFPRLRAYHDRMRDREAIAQILGR
ncbi:hypothetical protein F5Y09DRAFT_351355 [Xylaria sp. FL1042]|nr:hypothetical protein F5Y09DRAFT_351355 [Xylaria sp. FL1042]